MALGTQYSLCAWAQCIKQSMVNKHKHGQDRAGKNDNRDTPTTAKAKVETKAKLKVEAKVKDNDLATDNFLVGGWGEGKGKGGDLTLQRPS